MDNYEKLREENVKRNNIFLGEFESWLNERRLSSRTIRNHLSNVDLFLNDYLNYSEVEKMEDGCASIDMFMDWFMRKCTWSSVSSIKSTASSIKKFYQCMCDVNHISKEDYKIVCENIKENIDCWISEMQEYDEEIFDNVW